MDLFEVKLLANIFLKSAVISLLIHMQMNILHQLLAQQRVYVLIQLQQFFLDVPKTDLLWYVKYNFHPVIFCWCKSYYGDNIHNLASFFLLCAQVRPPGHHAGVNQAMGFCLHNNAAVAASAAQVAGAKRVLIVDWVISGAPLITCYDSLVTSINMQMKILCNCYAYENFLFFLSKRIFYSFIVSFRMCIMEMGHRKYLTRANR